MSTARKVSLFRNGSNQAVRIPRELEMAGDHAMLRREGDVLILEPIKRRTLFEVLDALAPIDEDFPEISDSLPDEVEI